VRRNWGMARGFFQYPRAVRGPDFNNLVADLGDDKSCIARYCPGAPPFVIGFSETRRA
jgi:hypothetical protein